MSESKDQNSENKTDKSQQVDKNKSVENETDKDQQTAENQTDKNKSAENKTGEDQKKKHNKAVERISKVVKEDNVVYEEKLALPFRIYGILCIVFAVLFIPLDILSIQAIADIATSNNGVALSQLNVSVQYAIMIVLELVADILQTIVFLVLGIRIVRNKRRGAARLAQVLIWVSLGNIVLILMNHGFCWYLAYPAMALLTLAIMHTALDPQLQAERKQHRKEQELQDKADQEAGTLGRDKTGEGFFRVDFFNIFWIFVIGSILGMLVECGIDFFLDGTLENKSTVLWGPFCPIYGFVVALLAVSLNKTYKKGFLAIFIVAGGFLEYLICLVLQLAFGIVVGKNGIDLFNINIVDDVADLILWGVIGLVLIKVVVPLILKLINKIPWNWRYGITIICTAFMAINLCMTLLAFECWYLRASGKPIETPIEQFFQDNYDDNFMAEHFSSMDMDPNKAERSES